MVFQWDETHQHAFVCLKELVSSSISLVYYNPHDDTTLEVDSSMKGMGAVIVQNQAPVAFAITQTQSNYSNLERECLAVVHGIRRFNHYLFGKPFVVVTDHKPLEMIFRKPIHRAPLKLQRMMIKIIGYDFQVKYCEGKSMVLADTLSRAPNMAKTSEVELDVSVDSTIITQDDFMNFTADKVVLIRNETNCDPVLHELTQIIYTGWPDEIKDLPHELREYWNYHDELALEKGIIFKGKQVIIPKPIQEDIM